MTPVYEVKTTHTQKVLEDFIKFTYRIKYPRVTTHLLILSACFAAFAYFTRGGVGMYIFIVLAVLLAGFTLNRHRISFRKLAKVDKNYQNQSEIHLVFGESEFHIENIDLDQNERITYAEISFVYVDDNNYYISINNEDLQLLPKSDFVLGDPTQFYDFLSDKTGQPIRPLYIPWKVRIQMMMEYRDVRAEQVKKRQEEKKKNKR